MQTTRPNYLTVGYEDLELSTQILIKSALDFGIHVEILDRKDHFIRLTQGKQAQIVKQATKTQLDSYICYLIMENKVMTKIILKEQGFRVPGGEQFYDLKQALNHYPQIKDTAIVVKPKSTNFGIGVHILKDKFTYSEYQDCLQEAFKHDPCVLVENFLTGKEYRFLVLGDEACGVLERIPAHVMGDGKHTIEELVTIKNQDPWRQVGHIAPLEKIKLGEIEKETLLQQNFQLNSIVTEGTTVWLRRNSNISTGGDSVDITEDMHESYKKMAVQAAQACGAHICGVDMLVDDFSVPCTHQNYGLIELNFNPAIHLHTFPYKGKNRSIAPKLLKLLGFNVPS